MQTSADASMHASVRSMHAAADGAERTMSTEEFLKDVFVEMSPREAVP
jgi:hypothetical protein